MNQRTDVRPQLPEAERPAEPPRPPAAPTGNPGAPASAGVRGSQGTGTGAAGAGAAGAAGGVGPRPNLTGDLDSMMATGPGFSWAVRGYDRLQVDNYVSWVEGELRTARRLVEDLNSRYGSALAELELSRRLLASSPAGREMIQLSERIGRMLQIAADEASELAAAGAEEADRIVGEARTEADAILRKAREVKEAALAAGDRIRDEARVTRAEAHSVLDRARREAAEQLRVAALERRRLDEQNEQARACLREVTEHIGAAIGAVADDLTERFGEPGEQLPLPHRFQGNTVQRLGPVGPVPAGDRVPAAEEPGGSGDERAEPAPVAEQAAAPAASAHAADSAADGAPEVTPERTGN